MLCGFLDGKHGIPELAEPRADERARDFAPPPAVRTPRIDMLIRQANQRIEGEWSNLVDDRVRLKQRRTEHQITFDALSKELLITEGRMTEARHPLSDHERDARRLAESDQQSRPAGLVRARRQEAWDRRRVLAEETHRSATREWTRAHHQAQLGSDLIGEREAAARAAARRHHEYALRRIATYLQLLVRTHPKGRRLNSLLGEYQVAPDLPEWTKEPPRAGDQEPGSGSVTAPRLSRLQEASVDDEQVCQVGQGTMAAP